MFTVRGKLNLSSTRLIYMSLLLMFPPRAFGPVENQKPICFLQNLKEAWPEVDPSVPTWEGTDFSSLPLIVGISH